MFGVYNICMNENEFYKKLEEINKHVEQVKIHVKPKLWRSFLDGVFRGAGSIVGVVLALFLIGWVLNIIGVIPAFREQVDEWKGLIDRAAPQRTLK